MARLATLGGALGAGGGLLFFLTEALDDPAIAGVATLLLFTAAASILTPHGQGRHAH